ncbi:MAG: thiamine-monophosphate kinase [Phycisphaerales bacterium]|nr:thiamine-monophosphate kinase [Phycisphaerales bacterium]
MRWLHGAAGIPQAGAVGIGDDMASLRVSGTILVSCDLLLEGTHFDPAQSAWHDIGRKAAGCGLSDCAAMAVQPVAATVALVWTRGRDVAEARELMGGVIAGLAAFDCVLIGGDTTSWTHPVAIDVTIMAQPFSGIEPIRRDGAKPGDRVCVTGKLGGSILGRHLTFKPRVHEARALAAALGDRLHAMMDVTDGLAIDLDRIAEASRVGAVLDERLVELVASDAAHELAARDGRSVRDHVLGDGEDFELLVIGELNAEEVERLGLLCVGEIVDGSGLVLRDTNGATTPLAAMGYEHL